MHRERSKTSSGPGPASNQSGNPEPAQKYSSKPSGTSHIPNQREDCHHTREKPNSFRAPALALQAPLLPRNKAANTTEPRRIPGSYLAPALAPLTLSLPPSWQLPTHPGEDAAQAHFRSSSPTKATGYMQTAQGCSQTRTCSQDQDS